MCNNNVKNIKITYSKKFMIFIYESYNYGPQNVEITISN